MSSAAEAARAVPLHATDYDAVVARIAALSSEDAHHDASAAADAPALLRPRSVGGAPFVLIDTLAGVAAVCALLSRAAAVAVDCEGVNLGRTGSVATLQLCGEARGTTYIVDVATLGAAAFARGGAGLRELLEAPAPAKIFFDCRSDAGALFHHFGVALPRSAGSVVDLQLLDVAHAVVVQRRAPPRLSGLGFLLERTAHARMRDDERAAMAAVKARARALFAPEAGGDYGVWLARPLSDTLLEYATDVRFFHTLRESFAAAADRALRAAAAQHAAAAALGAAVARRLDDAQGLLFTSDDREANVRVDAALVGDLAAAAGCAPALDGTGAGAAQLRPSGVAAPGAPAFRSKPCRNFAAGHCRFGDACAFRH